MLRVALVLTLFTLPALAEPSKPFTEQLKKGRALEAKGKHAEAAAAFEAALRAVPDDPAALAELGWVQYKRNDLKAAEASTRAALAGLDKTRAPDEEEGAFVTPHRIAHGEALYNLGRILQDGGDKAGAIKAYSDAHHAYPRAVVRDQLAKLDAAAAAALEPFRPGNMEGPFASIAAYCKSFAKANDDSCGCQRALKSEGPSKLAAPFEQVAVFARRSCDEDNGQMADLAVKLPSGWFVTTAVPSESNNSTDHCTEAQWRFKSAAITQSTLHLDYTTKADCETKGSTWGWDEHATVVVGVGPSGKPSATPPITSTWDMLPEHTLMIRAKLTWSDGAVQVTGKFRDKPDELNLAGKHALVFP